MQNKYLEQELCNQELKQKYKIIMKLGEGTYGVVYKCENQFTKKTIALKKLKLDIGDDEGIPSTTIREIAILKKARHPNIVDMSDIYYSLNDQKLFLEFEFIEYDLKKYIDTLPKHVNVPIEIIKAVNFLHSKRIIHRDLKPQNILIDSKLKVKVADFGLARCFSVPQGKFTKDIATLWYRPPELMMGDDSYSITIDMWAVGCILGELITKRPIFQGDSQIDMLFRMFQALGSPNEQNYYGVSKLPEFKTSYPKFKGDGVESLVPDFNDEQGLDLLRSLLNIDPNKRPTAKEALTHPFFDNMQQK